MAFVQESATLRLRDGRTAVASVAVERRSAGVRAVRAGWMAGAGLVLGVASVVVPILHLVSTWALPLAGAIGAWFAWNSATFIGAVRAACPACAADAEIAPNGALDSPHWLRCPHCQAPLELSLESQRGG